MARLIDEVLGHAQVWQSLMDLRLRQHLPHAMAFTGRAGVGKRKMAWALAQALVCERQSERRPCGECGPCRRVALQQSESVLALEPEGPQIKLVAAHQVLEFLSLRRLGGARVVIVDSAQALNPQAANALLKVIEEPPPESFFIFVLAEWTQLLPTLRSRLQNIRFSPLSDTQLKQLAADSEAWLIRSARGSLDQLNALQSEATAELRALALRWLKEAAADTRAALDVAQSQLKDRTLAIDFARLFQQVLRDWAWLEVDREGLVHMDLRDEIERLPGAPLAQRLALWRQAAQLEVDLNAHGERGLLLENFYYRTCHSLR